jgi:hypothetical protein
MVYVVRKWPLRGRSLFGMLEYHTIKPVFTVQLAFRTRYAKDPPTDKTIRVWYKQFIETEEYRCTHVDVCVPRT